MAKVGKNVVTVTASFVDVYNCAMGTLGSLVVQSNVYCFDRESATRDECLNLAKEFLQWVRDPGHVQHASTRWGTYNALSFLVFHDNIKYQGYPHPLCDMSSWLQFIHENEDELKCRVIQTPMANNFHHPPPGSHPGRVQVLIPPYAQVYDERADVPQEHKDNLRSHVLRQGLSITKKDMEIIEKMVGPEARLLAEPRTSLRLGRLGRRP